MRDTLAARGRQQTGALSQAMFLRLRFVLAASYAFVLVLTLNEELLKRLTEQKIESLEDGPITFAESLVIAGRFMSSDRPEVAVQFVERAVQIAPHDPAATGMLQRVRDALEISREERFYSGIRGAREAPSGARNTQGGAGGELRKKDENHMITELLEMSNEASDNGEWFDAHYWAQLAVDACNGTNTNLQSAMQRAARAWNMLSVPPAFDNSQEREHYQEKKSAYEAFVRGDYLEAYYAFVALQNDYSPRDPDVEKFLALSQEQVENQYFFSDETEYMQDIISGEPVYFALQYPDGSRNVFFISNTMDIRRQGGLVSYLENLYVVHYDRDNNFVYSFYVPFAKAVATPISEFGSVANRQALGINSSWDYVPVLTLQSIDRNTEGTVSTPEYTYSLTGLPEDVARHLGFDAAAQTTASGGITPANQSARSMMLPMSFDDFHVLSAAASGPERLPLWTLYSFLSDTQAYGFSKDSFTQNFVQRAMFPLILMIMFIFCACIGWNYRIEDPGAPFKFRWLILIPVFGAIMIILFDIVMYAFNMLNYIFVLSLGFASVIAALALYIALLIAGVILFLSRKA